MRVSRCAIAAVLLAASHLVSAQAAAGTVTVETKQGRIVVVANEASLDEIMARLGEAQGFQIVRAGAAASPEPFTGRFEGSLNKVLERVLHTESHMVVHSANVACGIARIVLFGAKREGSGEDAASPLSLIHI